jgi:FkbM family methyltransferase
VSGRVAAPSESGPAIVRRMVGSIWTHPENSGRRGRALGKYLAWQIWERTVRRPWTVKLRDGIRIRCYPHSPISSAVIYFGLADHPEMRFLLDYLRPGDTFVDVGANVGVYSLLACAVPGVEVLAFEPSAATFDKARENVRLNGLEDRVKLVREAVGSAESQALLTVGLDAMNALVEGGSPDSEVEAVPVTTLDSRVPDGVALVKIDVEGWETEVLSGASGLLTRQRPALIVEVNDVDGLEEIRRRFGYECVAYRPETRELVPATLSGARGHNVILVADAAGAAALTGAGRSSRPAP